MSETVDMMQSKEQLGKNLNGNNVYKDPAKQKQKGKPAECNIIWSDIGLQPEKLQNMKPFQ